MLVPRAFRMQTPIVRWVPELWGHLQLMQSCSPDPQHAVHHLQCRQTALLTSLLVKLSRKKPGGFALRTNSDPKTKQEFQTCKASVWKLVLCAKQGLQGTRRGVGKGQMSHCPTRQHREVQEH